MRVMASLSTLAGRTIATLKQGLTGLVVALSRWSYHHAWVVVLVLGLLSILAGAGLYKTWPGVETSSLAALQRMSLMNPLFPRAGFRQTRLVLRLRSQDPMLLAQAAQAVARHLEQSAYANQRPVDHAFLARNELLFMDKARLQESIEHILATQALTDSLRSPRQTAEFMYVLWQGIDRGVRGDGIELQTAIEQLSAAIDAALNHRSYHFDWHDIVLGERDDLARSEYFAFQLDRRAVPKLMTRMASLGLPAGVESTWIGLAALDFTDSAPATVDGVRDTAQIGDGSGSVEGLNAKQGAGIGFVFGMGGLFILLLWAVRYRPRWLLFALLANALLALALLVMSSLLFRSIGPYSLLIGAFLLLINTWLSAQLWWRYRELRRGTTRHAGAEPQDAEHSTTTSNLQALEQAVRDNSAVLLVVSVTLIVMFASFAVTRIAAWLVMGVLAISGSALMVLLLPSLLAVLVRWLPEPARSDRHPRYRPLSIAITGLPLRFETFIKITAWLLPLSLVSLLIVPAYQYDALSLWKSSAARQDFTRAITDPLVNPWSVDIWAGSFQQGLLTEAALFEIPDVKDVTWLGDWIPEAQASKRRRLSSIAMLAGLEDDYFPPLSPDEAGRGMSESLLNLRARLGRLTVLEEDQPQLVADARGLIERIGSLLSVMKRDDNDDPIGRLDHIFRQGSVDFRQQLRRALKPEPVSVATLPPAMRSYWQDANGRVRLRVVPVGDMAEIDERRDFVHALASAGVSMDKREIQWAADGPTRMLGAQTLGLPLGWLCAALLIIMLVQRRVLMFVLLLGPLAAFMAFTAIPGLSHGWDAVSIAALPAFSVLVLAVNLAMVQRSQDSTLVMGNIWTSASSSASLWLLALLVSLGLLLDQGDGYLALVGLVTALCVWLYAWALPGLYLMRGYKAGE